MSLLSSRGVWQGVNFPISAPRCYEQHEAQHGGMSSMHPRAYVPVTPARKPFWGNLALALAVLAINGVRITVFLVAAALSAKGNLLDPRRYR